MEGKYADVVSLSLVNCNKVLPVIAWLLHSDFFWNNEKTDGKPLMHRPHRVQVKRAGSKFNFPIHFFFFPR